MIKRILLTAAALFLIWQSYELLRVIDQVEPTSWGSILFLAFLLNLYLTGIFAFAGFAFPTQRLLPDRYYHIAHPNRLKQVYRQLRAATFKQFLLATFWRSKQQQKRYFSGKKAGLDHLALQTKKSEFGHLIPFVLLLLLSLYLVLIGSFRLGGLTLLINVIGNLYPILLQRHHRMRIQAIQERSASRP